MAHCDFLTNHAKALVRIAHDRQIRIREVADFVGVTERAAHRLVSELVEEGYVLRERRGRRNFYRVEDHLPLSHPVLAQELNVGDLLQVLVGAMEPAVVPDDAAEATSG